MRAPEWIRETRARIDSALEAYFEAKRREVEALSGDSAELVEAVRSLTMRGGKRLRPVVLVAAYNAVLPERKGDAPSQSSESWQAPCSAGAALELLQSYLLIHDDWMDGDDERRGGPSVHRALAESRGNAHLGHCLGILAGDLASTYAWELLIATPFPQASREAALSAFVQIQKEVLLGQRLDLIGAQDVTRTHQLKTGSYTVRGPLRLGALLGGANEGQLAQLERFGTPLGLAFQLRDDLLGTFGDPSQVGKPVGNDLRTGKRTALVEEAKRHLPAIEWAWLEGILGNEDAGDAIFAEATAFLTNRGIRDRVERRLRNLLDEAKSSLDPSMFRPEGYQQLDYLADLLALRDR